MGFKLIESKKKEKTYRIIEKPPGDNGNTYSTSKRLYSMISVKPEDIIYSSDTITNEDLEPMQYNGGIIIFSTDVNAIELSPNKLKNYILQKLKTMQQRLTYGKKIDKIANNHNLIGWTIGNYLHGHYHSNVTNQNYSKKSISVQIVGVDTPTLLKIASELCRDFYQESVMVQNQNDGHIYFVEPNDTERI